MDRRAVRPKPTAKAVADLRRVEENWAQSFAATPAALSEEQRNALVAALPALQALGTALKESSWEG
ncbi:hypothetical protein [Streptomyces roseoverticillatus]|uniref:hypothetical protein n=1 Tax=Streptomyces roseoverticillatus TaxID=66429 RepID=UPI0004BF47C3|nr:hypothetical protein [Streptomyces roseoverticillatus]